MDRYESMRIFTAVADARSFAAAARQLGLSAPAVSRAVVALEEHLGAQLLRRTTRSVTLTEAGARYHGDCKRILADIAAAEASATGAHVLPQGELTVTAPLMFGRIHVAPLLVEFLAAHPAIRARGLYSDHIVHLLDEGIDVALRIARLPDSGLTAIRLGHVRRVVVASPAYLAQHGTPRSPDDLGRHSLIGYAAGATTTPWEFWPPGRRGRRDRILVEPSTRFTTNSNETAITAALSGHGLARSLSYQVAADVAAGRLRVVLQEYEPAPIPVQIVHAGGRRPPAKVKVFVEFAAERLRREPVLNGRFAWPP